MRVQEIRRCLAASAKSTPPERKHSIPKHPRLARFPGCRAVVEVALHDRLEPSSGLGHRIAHAVAELLLDRSQLSSHALADRCAPQSLHVCRYESDGRTITPDSSLALR